MVHCAAEQNQDALAVLTRVRAFCFPGGEAAARLVKSVRTTEHGEMRASPTARWIPFAATQVVEAARSSFRWEARMSGGMFGSILVIDAYEEGHGRLVVKKGPVPLKTLKGPDADKGELQRYLASFVFCPPMLLNHPSLEWTAAGPETLHVGDRQDPTGASVDVDFGADGAPRGCHAERPRTVGKGAILTPWSASCGEFVEREGLRIPSRLEVTWHLPEGPFTYFRTHLAAFVAER